MTKTVLLEELKSFCEKTVKNMPLPVLLQKGDKKRKRERRRCIK